MENWWIELLLRKPLNLSILLIIIFSLWRGTYGQTLRLHSFEIESLPPRANLVLNFGFEELQPGGKLPSGWIWDKRNTNATCEIDRGKVHSGKYSLKFTNGTPFGAHIYGTLWTAQPIRLSSGKPHTISAYVLSTDPGIAWVGGGSNWQIRLGIPPTGGKWKRIWLTFIPSEADVDFVLRIVTESPTKGFWIDDVKLEEGSEPTPCFSSSIPGLELEPLWNEDEELSGEDEFSLPFLIYSPRDISAKLSAKIGNFPPFKDYIKIPSGASKLLLKGEALGIAGIQALNLRIGEGGKTIMNSDFSIRFISPSGVEARLKKIEVKLPPLKKGIEELRRRGEDVSYPTVTYTVLENFIQYAEEDLNYYKERKEEWVLKRAFFAVEDMEKMLGRLEKELNLAEAGKLHFPKVPRWTGEERPQISGLSFIAPTVTPGSSPQRRPLFFNGYGAFGQVRADIEKFPNYGVNIIQVEFGPNGVFPREGEVSDAPIKEMLSLLERASKSGVAVNLLISPHYFPSWMLEKYPHLRKRREGFLQYCLHAPESKELLLRYIKIIVPPLKDHPALHSICLANEPVNVEEPCEYALKDWHNWLKKKHTDIATLNSRWGSSYSSFSEIPLPNPFGPGFTLQTPLGMDYVLFNQEWFADWHKMLADAIHEIAPDLPVHTKAMTWTLSGDIDVRFGVDAELFADFSQINGNDSANFYSHGQGEFAQGWIGNLMPYDLQRSMKTVPIFNSENHIIPDRETRYIPPEHIRCALWQEAIYGQGATTIWIWERTHDPRSDFAGSIMERPACAEAVGIVNYDLNRLAEYVTSLQMVEPRVAIIMSNSAKVWDMGRYADCLGKLYTALTFCGVRIAFVSERQLERGEFPSTPLLFVPDMEHISDKAFQSLKNYKGKIIFVGGEKLLSLNEYNQPRSEAVEGERLEYRYGETTWRDLWVKLWVKLRDWGIRPMVEVVDRVGKPVWGVAWLSREWDRGLLVNICNYRNEKVEVKLRGGGKSALDLLSGKRISAESLVLSPLEFRLILLEKFPK